MEVTATVSLEGVSLEDLPLPFRTFRLRLNGTGLLCTFEDVFRSLRFVEDLDLSGTFVSGRLSGAKPAALRSLVARDTLLANITDPSWLALELLDVRRTTFWQANAPEFRDLVFRGGNLTCADKLEGHAMGALLCAACEPGYYWSVVGDFGSCEPCRDIARWLAPAAALLLMMAACFATALYWAGGVRGLGKAVGPMVQQTLVRTAFLLDKAKYTAFALQKVARLRQMGVAKPDTIQVAVSRLFALADMPILSSTSLSRCAFGGGYHLTYCLTLIQTLCYFSLAMATASVVGKSAPELVFFVYTYTHLTVAGTTVGLFLCDARLQQSNLPGLLPPIDQPSFLKADYSMDCGAHQHRMFQVFGGAFFLFYCVGVLGFLLLRLLRVRHLINPPLPGIDAPVMTDCQEGLAQELLPSACEYENSSNHAGPVHAPCSRCGGTGVGDASEYLRAVVWSLQLASAAQAGDTFAARAAACTAPNGPGDPSSVHDHGPLGPSLHSTATSPTLASPAGAAGVWRAEPSENFESVRRIREALRSKRPLGRSPVAPGWGHAEAWAIALQAEGLRKHPEAAFEFAMVAHLVPSKWWWLFLPFLGRMVVAAAPALPQAWQTVAGAMSCTLLGVGVLWLRPYRRRSDAHMEAIAQISVALTYVTVGGPGRQSDATTAAVVQLLCLLSMFAPLLAFGVYALRRHTRWGRDGILAEEAFLRAMKVTPVPSVSVQELLSFGGSSALRRSGEPLLP